MKDLDSIYFGDRTGGDLTNRDQLAAVIRRLPYRELVRIGGEMGKGYDSSNPDDISTDLTKALDAWAQTVAVEWEGAPAKERPPEPEPDPPEAPEPPEVI